jgi:hypothetical protein
MRNSIYVASHSPTSSGTVPENSIEKAKAIILALDRTLRSRRLYAANNPILIRHFNDLFAQFQSYFSVYGEVTFRIEPFEFQVDGTTVYQNSNEQESFAFKLFNDGIRSLRFQQGLTDTELGEFLTALLEDFSDQNLEADSVTSFWEREFEHIRYTVADSIINEPLADEKSTDEKIEEVVDAKMAGYHGPATEPDDDAYEEFNAENLKITLNVNSVGQMFQNRVVLSEVDLKAIQDDLIECDREERLALDFVDMVLAVLMEEKDKVEFQKYLESLGSVLDQNLLQNHLHVAAMIMEQVHFFPKRPIHIAKVDPNFLSWALKILWPTPRLELLFTSLNQPGEVTPENIDKLITRLDPTSVPSFLNLIPTIVDPERRRVICHAVAKLHKGDIGIFTKMLSSPDQEVVRTGLEIVSHLKNDKVVDLMTPFVQRQSRMFRKESIELLKNYRSPKVYKILIDLLNDPSEDIRVQALHSLETADTKEVARDLMLKINHADFQTRTFRERKSYITAVARIARDDFTPYLQSLLNTRTWFQKPEMEEQYKLAAYGLALIGTANAIEALKKGAASRNKSIKRLSETALRHIQVKA